MFRVWGVGFRVWGLGLTPRMAPSPTALPHLLRSPESAKVSTLERVHPSAVRCSPVLLSAASHSSPPSQSSSPAHASSSAPHSCPPCARPRGGDCASPSPASSRGVPSVARTGKSGRRCPRSLSCCATLRGALPAGSRGKQRAPGGCSASRRPARERALLCCGASPRAVSDESWSRQAARLGGKAAGVVVASERLPGWCPAGKQAQEREGSAMLENLQQGGLLRVRSRGFRHGVGPGLRETRQCAEPGLGEEGLCTYPEAGRCQEKGSISRPCWGSALDLLRRNLVYLHTLRASEPPGAAQAQRQR